MSRQLFFKFNFMKKTYTVTVKPTKRFITLDEAKNHLKVDLSCDTDDTLILSLIEMAHEVVEKYCNILIGSQTLELTFDNFDEYCYLSTYILPIEKYPLISVSSIKYKDETGTYQTLSSTKYEVDTTSIPARIRFNEIPTYSTAYLNAIKITFTAGLTTLDYSLKAAIFMIISHFYENRQDVITGTIVTEVPMNSRYLMDKFTIY